MLDWFGRAAAVEVRQTEKMLLHHFRCQTLPTPKGVSAQGIEGLSVIDRVLAGWQRGPCVDTVLGQGVGARRVLTSVGDRAGGVCRQGAGSGDFACPLYHNNQGLVTCCLSLAV